MVSKPFFRPNLRVGACDSILEILNVWIAIPPVLGGTFESHAPPSCPADLWRGILNLKGGFEATSIDKLKEIDLFDGLDSPLPTNIFTWEQKKFDEYSVFVIAQLIDSRVIFPVSITQSH